MAEWLSACIKKQPKVGDALRDLTHKVRDYRDAAKPSSCTGSTGGFWRAELALFRPGWKLFVGISIVCGIASVIFSLFVPNYVADKWADLALAVTVPIFVLGISLVAVARSMSESGRFAVEYLNESCRMEWFCCLTFMAVLTGVIGRFLCTVEWVPNFVTVGLCAASLGAAVDCLAMLAFVVCETIRCSMPSESIRVVSQYAGRKLCYGYLKEAYITLFRSQYRLYLEKWCVGRAIHPPSQYYLHSGKGNNNCVIELDGCKSGQNMYKDYDLERLAGLDKYLKDNDAELYLSSPDYESEKRVLGILSSENIRQNERLKRIISKRGGESIRWRKLKLVEEDEDFWESQQSALDAAIDKAVERVDPIQVKAYLDAVNVPLSVMRQVRKKHKVLRDAYGEYIRRGYDFVRLYLRALREILERHKSKPRRHGYRILGLERVVRNSVWGETKKILRDMDYHTMGLFTWLVPQMYRVVQETQDEANPLREIRAQFGGFYKSADGWLDDSKSGDTENVDKMRLVLHEGLTKWLLIAIEKKDGELIEQLCDAARVIVFGHEGINFNHRKAVLQHFVLAGHLIRLTKSGQVNATAIERLFCEDCLLEMSLNFNDLVGFYLDSSLPLERLDSYLNIFYSPNITWTNLLTGSSSSSGFGMSGSSEMSRTFVFLAAHALKSCDQPPEAVADMSGRITEEDIKCVEDVFKAELSYFFGKIRDWIKKCDDLDDEEETKEIAKAKLNEEKKEEHKRKFWEGYLKSIPVVSLCLKNGNYKIDNTALIKWRYILPKIALIDWKYSVTGSEGNEFGRLCGRDMQTKLLFEISEKYDEETELKGGLSDVFSKAVGWLKEKGCNGDNGIVIAFSKRSPDIVLHSDDNYVPSWKEDVRLQGFDGFYDGFPIVWVRDRKKKSEEEGKRKVNKPRHERVVAVDLRGWTGISVREDVVKERKFGELDVWMWKDEEIQQAVESGKLNKKDVDKAKCNCPVDVTFYWQFSSDELPRGRIFILEKGDVGEIRSTNPSTLLRT